MKRIACFFVVPFLVVACGNKTATPQPKGEDALLAKKPDMGTELKSEGYVKCNPDKFVPITTRFREIESSQNLAYGIHPSKEFNGKASLSIWGGKSECIDNVHKLALYGTFEPSIMTQIGNDNVVRYFVQRDDAIYLVGSNKSGELPLCSGIENCSYSVSKDAEGKLMIMLSLNDTTLVNEEIHVSSEPKFIPMIGGK